MHKIIFICGSVEIGKDGIGDYTRRLALQCNSLGKETAIIALYDSFIEQDQHENGMLRISDKQTSETRLQKTLKFIDEFRPDGISLQFMPYAFHKRGVVLDQINFFKKITHGYPLEIMCHELWIGAEKGSSLKNQFIGKIQKFSILRFLKKLKPKIIHTSILLNQVLLTNEGFKAKILPLFGNIPIENNPSTDWIYEALFPITDLNVENRSQFLVFGVFGTWYDNWDINSLFASISKDQSVRNKKIIVALIGNNGNAEKKLIHAQAKFPSIFFIQLGRRNEREISSFLHFIDFGIATTPYILLGKSGSFMAFIEHGVPVFCDINKIKFNFELPDVGTPWDNLTIVDQNTINFRNKLTRREPVSHLKIVANQLIKDLENS